MSEQVDFFTIGEVARKLSMSHWTISKWVKTGELDSVRIGRKSIRIPAGAIVKLLNQGADKAVKRSEEASE